MSTNFGLFAAADKNRIVTAGFKSISVSGATAYFYKTETPSATPDFTLNLSTGLLPVIRVTATNGKTITATCGAVILTGTIKNESCDIGCTCYGAWNVSDGSASQTVEVDTVKLYTLTF